MTDHDKLFWPITVVAGVALALFLLYVALRDYDECRATPHTVFYCLTGGK